MRWSGDHLPVTWAVVENEPMGGAVIGTNLLDVSRKLLVVLWIYGREYLCNNLSITSEASGLKPTRG